MTTLIRAVTFNVNQHDSVAHQRADLVERMKNADVVLCQETVGIDLKAFAATQAGWAAFQVRVGDNDGHANTGVLYRVALGAPDDTVCTYVGDARDTRRRFLTAVHFPKYGWAGAVHIFPARDRASIAAELASIGAWVKGCEDDRVLLGLDKNQASVESLEKATGLTWYGIDIDGFLTNLALSAVAAFKPGFSDHDGVHAVADVPAPKPPTPGPVKPPSPPYLGPAAHTSSGDNKPVTRIVMHSTVSPCQPGGARDIARYFRSPTAGGSAHYVVDPGEVVQVVYDSVIAWHAPPNPHSIGIEMCDIPGPLPGDHYVKAVWKAAKRRWRWRRSEQVQMLRRAARLCARLCAAYEVPVEFLTVAALKKGRHGVTTHNNVSLTWHESTHWDPGFWPRRRFMKLVKAEYNRLTK